MCTFLGSLQRFLTLSKASMFLEESISFTFLLESAMVSAFPIPEEAPVTQITLFAKDIVFFKVQYTYFALEIVFLVHLLNILFYKHNYNATI